MIIKSSIKFNIVLNTFYQILSMCIPLITAPYISRVLGNENIGIYSYTSSIVTFFSLFSGLGTAIYGAREISRNREDKYKVSQLFWEIEIVSLISSSICFILWMIWIYHTSHYKIIYIILSFNILNFAADISWFYNGLEQFKYEITKNSIVKILGVVLIFWCVKNSDDLIRYILISSASTFLGTLSMWISIPKFIVKINIRSINIWPHFKETLIYFIPTIATSFYTVLDKTLIGIISIDPNENGFYEQATKIITLTQLFTFVPINNVIQSRNSYLFAVNDIDGIKKIIKISLHFCLTIGLGIFLGILAIGDIFIPIFYGNGYEGTIPILYILSPIIVISSIGAIMKMQYYTPLGLKKEIAIYIIVGVIINLVLNIMLIPYFRAIGAAFASVIAETVITFLYLYKSNNIINIKDITIIAWTKVIAGVIMMIVVFGLKKCFAHTIQNLLFCITIGIVIYFSVLMILKDVFIYYTVIPQVKTFFLRIKNVIKKED